MNSTIYTIMESVAMCALATVIWLLPDTLFNSIAIVIMGAFFVVLTLASILLYVDFFDEAISIDRAPYFTFGDVTLLYCTNIFLYTKHFILFFMALFVFVVQLLKLIEVRKEISSG